MIITEHRAIALCKKQASERYDMMETAPTLEVGVEDPDRDLRPLTYKQAATSTLLCARQRCLYTLSFSQTSLSRSPSICCSLHSPYGPPDFAVSFLAYMPWLGILKCHYMPLQNFVNNTKENNFGKTRDKKTPLKSTVSSSAHSYRL